MSGIGGSERLLPLTENDFCVWVGRAEPGDILEYHRGFLGIDTHSGARSVAERKALRQLARRAAWAFDEGLVHLVQRRKGPFDLSYLAIRRPRLRTARNTRRKAGPTANKPELKEAA